ncbi:hypothetical protein BD410DRAFT_803659 [Rickenella mellea]|uniref:Uncharacterized protein n=1 Tax=Rickenella mellea TaxID=50990 RepID=A0A4Y7Q4C5_9AGAM|nr:hypothetical protein BD410DRAFT_803659 [Rickenella mellea]
MASLKCRSGAGYMRASRTGATERTRKSTFATRKFQTQTEFGKRIMIQQKPENHQLGSSYDIDTAALNRMFSYSQQALGLVLPHSTLTRDRKQDSHERTNLCDDELVPGPRRNWLGGRGWKGKTGSADIGSLPSHGSRVQKTCKRKSGVKYDRVRLLRGEHNEK